MNRTERLKVQNATIDKKYLVFEKAVYVIMAIFYFWLAAQIPYTHDDWDWGLPIGMEQLLTASINSRYVGNFFVVIMTRSEIVKTLIMGATCWLIPYLITRFAFVSTDNANSTSACDRMLCFMICNMFILTMNNEILSQTYAWVSGFANYCISMLFLLVITALSSRAYDDAQNEQTSISKCVLAFVFCLAVQLFLENISCFVVLLLAVTNCVYYIKNRRVSKLYLTMLVGSIIGLIIMFSSSIYGVLWSDGEMELANRRLFLNSNSSIGQTIGRCVEQAAFLLQLMLPYSFIFYTIAQIFVLILMYKQQTVGRKEFLALMVTNAALIIVFAQYASDKRPSNLYTNYIAIMYILTLALIIFEMFLLFKNNKSRFYEGVVLLLSPAFVLLPLCMTIDDGPRLFLAPNIFIISFDVFLLAEYILQVKSKKRLLLTCFVGLGAIYALLSKGLIYYDIGKVKRERDLIVSNAIAANETVISLPEYPHDNYIWHPDPKKDDRVEYFYEFYGIASDTQVVFEGIQETE